MFRVGPYDQEAVLQVCQNLRADDWREISACRWPDFTPEALAGDVEALQAWACVAYKVNDPIAVMGATPHRPGVFGGYMFATDRFSEIGLPMTKWARRQFFPALRALGAHRVEAHSIADHYKAHAWIEAIGARKEGDVPRFGAGGEDFVRFAYLWDEDNSGV